MMDGVSPETCWASYKYEIKFWYTVASCWIFYVNYTMMHGSTNIKCMLLCQVNITNDLQIYKYCRLLPTAYTAARRRISKHHHNTVSCRCENANTQGVSFISSTAALTGCRDGCFLCDKASVFCWAMKKVTQCTSDTKVHRSKFTGVIYKSLGNP